MSELVYKPSDYEQMKMNGKEKLTSAFTSAIMGGSVIDETLLSDITRDNADCIIRVKHGDKEYNNSLDDSEHTDNPCFIVFNCMLELDTEAYEDFVYDCDSEEVESVYAECLREERYEKIITEILETLNEQSGLVYYLDYSDIYEAEVFNQYEEAKAFYEKIKDEYNLDIVMVMLDKDFYKERILQDIKEYNKVFRRNIKPNESV